MLYGCLSLSYLPDISKWNSNNVKDMSNMLDRGQKSKELKDFYVNHYYLYLLFQNGMLIILIIWVICSLIVHHYYLYLIFQNGILKC